MNRNFVRIVALVASVGFAACGDSTDVVIGELTEAEAQDLAGVVLFARFSSTGNIPTQPALSPDGPQAIPFSFASEFEGVVQCDLGGSVNVAASFEASGDTDSEAGHVEYSMTQVHDACVVMSENDRTFTLWGNPSMNVAFSVDNDGQGVVEWGGSVQGIIDWETDGREGSCSVQLEFAGRTELDVSATASMNGTVCGFSIDHSMSLG
jgi:hypothetical protein